MTLERLRAIVPPPEAPVEAGSEDGWPKVEAALGTALPDDYKRFTQLYGSGKFDDFLWLFNPFTAGEDGNLLDEKDAVLAAYAETRAKFPERLPTTVGVKLTETWQVWWPDRPPGNAGH